MTGRLETRGLVVRFPTFRLGPLDVTVEAGERVALVGANGSGKSTLLRAVAGRIGSYDGSVRVEGREVLDDPVGTRGRVGVLPERLLGFSWMRVGEHLDLLAGLHPMWDAAYARALCRELEVPWDTPLGDLSKGNRVKLSLAAAEAFRPPLLLLDEPTSGIDPVMRDRLLGIVDRCLPRGGDRTLVFSTHLLEDLEVVADRVLLLREGRLVGDAPVRALGEEGPVPAAIRRRLGHDR